MLRVVVRAGITHDMADLFLADLRKQTDSLESLDGPLPQSEGGPAQSFKH